MARDQRWRRQGLYAPVAHSTPQPEVHHQSCREASNEIDAQRQRQAILDHVERRGPITGTPQDTAAKVRALARRVEVISKMDLDDLAITECYVAKRKPTVRIRRLVYVRF